MFKVKGPFGFASSTSAFLIGLFIYNMNKYIYGFHSPKGSYEKIAEICNIYHTSSNKVYHKFFIRYMAVIDFISRMKYSNSDFVVINRNVLSSILGVNNKTTSLILKNLLDFGLMVKVRGFKASRLDKGIVGYSSGYTIPETDLIQILRTETDSVFVRNVISKRNKSSLNAFKDTKDGKLYYNYISNIKLNNTIEIINYNYISPIGVLFSVSDLESNIKGLKKIEEGDLFLSRPEGRRVICNFSLLHREFRKYLRYDGKPFRGLDIRNSQPLLAGTLIKKDYYGTDKQLDSEIEDYIELCEKGLFYEEFMGDDDTDRTLFKKRFFRDVFFSKNPKKRITALRRKFIDRFPNIHEVVKEIKGDTEDSYKQFAINLQKFESEIIFDGVNMPLLREGLGCFNIYDSIVSHSDEVLERARELIYKEFDKYGVKPTINIEDYTK